MPKFNIKAQAIPTVASAYADVIGTTDNQIVEIRNELIVEDNSQRFQIHDETIEQLAEHIAKDGQLTRKTRSKTISFPFMPTNTSIRKSRLRF